MKKHPEQMLTRRAFGRSLTGLAAASVLAVHGSSPQFAAAADDDVYVMMEKTFADIGVREATDAYNDQRDDSPEIKLEEAATGWEAKVLPQIRDKNVRWSGHGYIPFFDQYKEIKAGLVAPLEEYLEASSVPWAHEQKDVYFTSRIYDALVLDGKQYFIPMKSNVHLAGWRQDYLENAGYDTMPKTWDEVDQMLPKIKDANDDVIPFAIQRDLFRAVGTTFTTFVEKPLDEHGVFPVESPEWLDMIGMFKKWIDAGLARFDTNDIATDAWQKGKYAMSLSSHSWVRLGRQVWGKEKVRGGVPPQANADAPPRTWCHIDGGCVFNEAPNPLAAADWLLSVYGPEGEPADIWWKNTLTFSGTPVHQSMIDKYVKPNEDIEEVEAVLDILPNSHVTTLAETNGFNICQLRLPAYLDKVFNGELEAKDAMTQFRAEVDAELAKQTS